MEHLVTIILEDTAQNPLLAMLLYQVSEAYNVALPIYKMDIATVSLIILTVIILSHDE